MISNIFIYFLPVLLSILYFFDTTGIVTFFSTKLLYGSQILLFSFVYFLNKKKIDFNIFVKIFIFNLVFLMLRVPGLPEISSSIMGLSLTIQLTLMCFNKKTHFKDLLKIFIILMIFPLVLLFQESPNLASGIYIPNVIEFNEFFSYGLIFILLIISLLILKISKFNFKNLSLDMFFYSIFISFISFNLLSAQTGESYGIFFNLFAIIPTFSLLQKKNTINYTSILFAIIAFGFIYIKMDHFLLDRGLEINGENNYNNGLLLVNVIFYSLMFHSIYLRIKLWRSNYEDLR